MITRNFLLVILTVLALVSCSEDDDDTNTTGGSDNLGSFKIEVSGSQNYTFEGNAVMGRPAGDTALSIGLEGKSSMPPGLYSEATLNIYDNDGIYEAQDLPIKAIPTTKEDVQFLLTIEDTIVAPRQNMGGTLQITKAQKRNYLNGNFDLTAIFDYGGVNDTVQVTGQFKARDSN
jgi:hypothetical protein